MTLAFVMTLVSSLGAAVGAECMSAMAAFAAPPSCGTTVAAIVHYVVGMGSGGPVVESVKVSGLPPGCDGDPVVLDLYGNSAGNPTVSRAGDELLAHADSTMDPCTQQSLATPGLVTRGALTVSLCPRGGSAGVVSVHDLTAVYLSMDGTQVATAGGTTSGTTLQLPATQTSGSGARGLALAFTGVEIVGAVVVAGLTLLAGALLVVVSRRRQKTAEAPPA